MAKRSKKLLAAKTKKALLQPLYNVVDVCLEINQNIKLRYPKTYQFVNAVLNPVFVLLYLYDVYSDIQVAKFFFDSKEKLYAGLTTVFITFHYVLTGFILSAYAYKKLAWQYPKYEAARAGLVKRRSAWRGVKYAFKAARHLVFVLVLIAACILLVPFLDLSLFFRVIFPIVYYYLGADEDFMLQYAHIRHPLECFLESFPQTVLQTVYYQYKATDVSEADRVILLSSLGASGLSLLLNVLGLVSAARTSGFHFRKYGRLVFQFKGATNLPPTWRERMNDRILCVDRSIVGMETVQRKFLWAQIIRRSAVVVCHPSAVEKYRAELEEQRLSSAAIIAVDAVDFLYQLHEELPIRLIERSHSSLGSRQGVIFDFTGIANLPYLGENLAGDKGKAADEDDGAKDILEVLSKKPPQQLIAAMLNDLSAQKQGASRKFMVTGLTRLSLANCDINFTLPPANKAFNVEADIFKCWEALINVLHAPYLVYLDLSGNTFGEHGLMELAGRLQDRRRRVGQRFVHLKLRNIGMPAKLKAPEELVGVRDSLLLIANHSMDLDLSDNSWPVHPLHELLTAGHHPRVRRVMLERCILPNIDLEDSYADLPAGAIPKGSRILVEHLSLAATHVFKDAKQPLLVGLLDGSCFDRLVSLDLSSTGLTGQDLKNYLLQHVDAGKLPNLTQLDLSHNALRDDGLAALGSSLGRMPGDLVELNLSNISASLSGLRTFLGKMLMWQGQNLETLNLSLNAAYLPCVPPAAASAPADKKSEDDDPARQRADCSMALVTLLTRHKDLTRLDLSGVHLDWLGPGAMLFAKLLNTPLQELFVNAAPFGNDGAALFAHALKDLSNRLQVSQLRVLSLSRCNIDSLGFGFILDALAYDPDLQLEVLDLSYNRIKYIDLQEWKRFLDVNRRLTRLDLQFNLITPEVWEDAKDLLEEALKQRAGEWWWERTSVGAKRGAALEVYL